MISKKILYLLTCAAVVALSTTLPLFAQGPPKQEAAKSATPAATPAGTSAPASGGSLVTKEIVAVLDKQTAAWNKGDTDGFLAGYASDAVFISDTITRGIEKLRVRYQSHYPTRVSMGILTFVDVEVHSLDASHAFVIGHYHLQRAPEGGGDAGGVFSLLFKKTPTGWKIAYDHTT